MHRLIRRLLGIRPSPFDRASVAILSTAVVDGFSEGLRDPRPLSPEEMGRLMAYCEGVARRSFSTLYDDED
ncbi:hypothetical protein [Streptomyces mirabilis]|uniref:hypothetical protein n=1 Tax=Streptomyces mirabilis TaxID=68239 RepID=UPI0033D9C09F